MRKGRPFSMRLWRPKGSPFWHRQTPSINTSKIGDIKPPNSIHGQLPIPSSTKLIKNSEGGSPLQWKGGTRRQYKISPVYWHPYQKSTRRAPQGNIKLEQYYPENSDAELWAIRTDTSQCSPYQFQISVHGTIGTYECDNELHAGSVRYIVVNDNECNKDQ